MIKLRKLSLPKATEWQTAITEMDGGRLIEHQSRFAMLCCEDNEHTLLLSGSAEIRKIIWLFDKPVSWLPRFLQRTTVWYFTSSSTGSNWLRRGRRSVTYYVGKIINSGLESTDGFLDRGLIEKLLVPAEQTLDKLYQLVVVEYEQGPPLQLVKSA